VPDSAKVKLLFVGRLVKQKGAVYLLRALAKLDPAVLERVELEVIGSGPEEGRLRSLAGELGLGGLVRFSGWVPREQIVSRYQSADIFVLPSFEEGMANVVLEAMACGNAIITTDIYGNRDLVHDKANGLLIPPADPEALAQALTMLISDLTLRRRMAEKSRALAHRHDWAHVAERYLAISERVVSLAGNEFTQTKRVIGLDAE
jgi:glycosyltransferase involved in cell wall biosynthesis